MRSRWRTGAGIALAVTALSANLITGAGSAHAATTAANATATCKQVLFLGARGSGELGPGNYGFNSKKVKGDPYGFGGPVNSAYAELKGDFGNTISVQPVSVSYQANSVSLLVKNHNLYFADLSQGVTSAMSYLKTQAKKCPSQEIILAGYSQGAMVQHRVLHDLINTKADKDILERVDAAILIADGDQVANDNEVQFGTASKAASGIGHWYPSVSRTSGAKFPKAYSSIALRVCDTNDPVCDASSKDLDPLNVAVHLSYANSEPVLDAADVAAARLLNSDCTINPYASDC
jgi:hypothetical protein